MAWVKSICLLIVLAIALSNGYKKCRKVRAAPVDKDWVLEVGQSDDGWFVPMHSNCDNCKKNEAWSWLMKGRGMGDEKESVCWRSDIITKYGPLQLPFNCKYYKFEEQSCMLDTTHLKGKAKNKIGFGAEFFITLTDNKTFFAGTSCILGKENWWWVGSTTEELEEETKEEIESHFSRLGFKPENLATEGNWKKSPIIFKQLYLESAECKQ